MPDPGADSPDSPELAAAFPEAHQRIQAAIDYLGNGLRFLKLKTAGVEQHLEHIAISRAPRS